MEFVLLGLLIISFGLYAGWRAVRHFWRAERPRVRRVVGACCLVSVIVVTVSLWVPGSSTWVVVVGLLGPAALIQRAWHWSGQLPPEPPQPTRLFAFLAETLFGIQANAEESPTAPPSRKLPPN